MAGCSRRAKKIEIDFLQDDISISHKNVLRGLHGDKKTSKFVSCLYGSFQLIVVNNDPASDQFKKWESFDLSSENRNQILIPPKFGNGHLVLSDFAIREGIKEYSDWPTIPQVYLKGEFLGGSDILIEMYNSGSLKEKIEIELAS